VCGHAVIATTSSDKFGESGKRRVFKLIDNRFRNTGRNANVEFYEGAVVHLEDPEGTMRLFSYPYIEGSSVAVSGEQFYQLALKLEILHVEKRVVHGDIRAGNLVFHSDGKGASIIDFDFLGQHSGTFYPIRFNRGTNGGDIGDGCRHPTAKEGEPLSVYHDWFSLRAVALLYSAHVSNADEAEVFGSMLQEVERLLDSKPHSRQCQRDVPGIDAELITKLVHQFSRAKHVKFTDRTRGALLLLQGNCGTGSPPEKAPVSRTTPSPSNAGSSLAFIAEVAEYK
jgi:serine/threonine protein kinase